MVVSMPAMAVVHRCTSRTGAAVGGDGLVRIAQLIAQGVGDRLRDAGSQINLVEYIAVSLEELNLVQA